MDLVFEFILELFLEGGIEVSKNKKISKWIRYPILAIIILFFSIMIFGILFIGILLISVNILASIFMIGIGLFMLIGTISKFRKVYLETVNSKTKLDNRGEE